MENLPATKDQYKHWPETLQQVQLARVGEYFKDIKNEDIAALCKLIANERGLKIEDMDRTVSWLKNHFPHLRPKQFNLAFELYDARKLNEKYLRFKAYKYFTKEFIGIVLEGFKEYNQQKIKDIVMLEQKEKSKEEEYIATPEEREVYFKKLGELKDEIEKKFGKTKRQKPIISSQELNALRNRSTKH